MVKNKIAFFKSLSVNIKSTEQFALEVLNDPKYDNNPYIDKNAIQKAFDLYGYKLNPFNSSIYESTWQTPNIEGHFLAHNIPEVESLVVDKLCSEKILRETLDKNDDITHIGLSTYAQGMDNTLNLVKRILTDYSDKKLYVGGIGVLYPQLTNLVNHDDICFGSGINWLRKKFDLNNLSGEQIQISKIYSHLEGFPIPIKAAYAVTQIGCPFNCDFCITSKFLQYNPFSDYKKIINLIEGLSNESDGDIFLYLCDPNSFYPEQVWKKVFDYFIENKFKIKNQIFIVCLTSLNHLSSFDLEKIQKTSPVKFYLVNFGIESTLKGGYKKNLGISNEFIKTLNKLGIITFHNFIVGFPFHTKETIDLEIKRNLEYDSAWYSVNTYKPIPSTPIYNQLKEKNLLYGEDLPPEFLYHEGFFPFKHKYLGGGFNALEYAFKAYHECEKKVVDVYHNFSTTLLNNYAITNSRMIKQLLKIFFEMSRLNLPFFQLRMNENLTKMYDVKLIETRDKISYI